MEHQFTQILKWENIKLIAPNYNRRQFKNHKISVEGKVDLGVSAAKTFKGDETLHNPEDLLLSSLASCHMMSYLFCCEKAMVEVMQYEDHPIAFLEVHPEGSGRIKKVILKPKVLITDPLHMDLAKELHKKAKELCFIANSCNFEIEHQIVIICNNLNL